MIVSKYGKSYDTADGSEQQLHVSCDVNPCGLAKHGDSQRPEDDGGAAAGAPSEGAGGPLDEKPTWSVLSLRRLLEAIRLCERPETAAVIRTQGREPSPTPLGESGLLNQSGAN